MPTLKIKPGLEADRLSYTPISGELLFVTDTSKVYIGDGSTAGGIPLNLSSSELLSLLNSVAATGLDADTLDGLEGSQFLRNDQDGSIDGTLTSNTYILSNVDKFHSSGPPVEVKVYDTSKDSDGGAWRKSCQHLSWYNETLNTVTRGATREFPSVAIISVEVNTVTIYDGTKSDTPMWMVFNGDTPGISNGPHIYAGGSRELSSVDIVNGKMILGTISTITTGVGLLSIDFLLDTALNYTTSVLKHFHNISNRNTSVTNEGYIIQYSFDTLVNNSVRDVALTVLPDSPIHPGSSLPTPSIALATDGGVCIIHYDGNIVNIIHTDTATTYNVHFDENHALWYSANGFIHKRNTLPTSTENSLLRYIKGRSDLYYGGIDHIAYTGSEGYIVRSGAVQKINDIDTINNITSISHDLGLTLTKDFKLSPNLINFITKDYQTGWFNINAEGIFLANSKTTDRSPGDNTLTENGTIVESIVNTGSELLKYNDFSDTNYLSQAYNSDLDFGTGDFHIMGWFNGTSNRHILSRDSISENTGAISIRIASGYLTFSISDDGESTVDQVLSKIPVNTGVWQFMSCFRIGQSISLYINGQLHNSTQLSNATGTLSNATAELNIGKQVGTSSTGFINGELTLMRIGSGSIGIEQMYSIYRSERNLFNVNTGCTLNQTTNSNVNSLSYDKDSELLYVAGTNNLDIFHDASRIDSIDNLQYQSVSSSNGIIAKGY